MGWSPRSFRSKGDQLLLRELLFEQHPAVIAKGNKLKGRLAKINANGTNVHVDDPPDVTCQQHQRHPNGRSSHGPSQ
jgi:hypothetical protein